MPMTNADLDVTILSAEGLTDRFMRNGQCMVLRKAAMIQVGDATADDDPAVLALRDADMQVLRKILLAIQREAEERAA